MIKAETIQFSGEILAVKGPPGAYTAPVTSRALAAGGRVARRVARALCARGEPPRTLVRDATKARGVLVDDQGALLPVELMVSDVAAPHGVRRALEGIDIAFLALGSSLEQVALEQCFIDVAAEVGLADLVELSAEGARSDGVASVLRWHAAIEARLRRDR